MMTSDPQSLSHNVVTGVYEDRAGRLWVSTWGGGLNRLIGKQRPLLTLGMTPPIHTVWAPIPSLRCMRTAGMFWVATVGGISFFDGGGKPFQHYRSVSDLPNTLSHNVVRALHAGQSGVVWVGTEGGGLNKFDRDTENSPSIDMTLPIRTA